MNIENENAFDGQCFPSDNIYWTFNPLTIIIFIPIYQLLLAPYFDRYIPRTLRRVGIAVMITLLSFVFLLVLEFTGAVRAKSAFHTVEACHSLNHVNSTTSKGILNINIWFVLFPTILATIAELFGKIAGMYLYRET